MQNMSHSSNKHRFLRVNFLINTAFEDAAFNSQQNAFEKHLDVSQIHLKFDLNSHAHKLYKPGWVKELWTRQLFKD